MNSGCAVSDLVLPIAAFHTGHEKVMVMERGYHGNTRAAVEVSDYKFSHRKGQGTKDHMLKVPIPETYRGKYSHDDGSARMRYAEEAVKLIENKASFTIFQRRCAKNHRTDR